MCGIAGLLLSPDDLQRVDVSDMLRTLGLEIESRGRDATGVARLSASNRVHVTKAPQKATDFFTQHPGIGSGCRVALVHTRAWTRGDPKVNANNHPITSGPITGIHNGMVQNDDALYARYKWNRAAEVDSEAIFTAIHNLGWKEALELLEGSIACAWMDFDKPGHLFVARHSTNPLHIGTSESGSVVFASTNAAVAKAMAVLGSTTVTIDSIKEGFMLEFWTGEDGKLQTNVQEFTPPKPVYSRAGAWEYEGGAWFPRGHTGRGNVQAGATSHTTTTSTGTRPPLTSAGANDWGCGAEGYVLRVGDFVVFEPEDRKNYDPMYGKITSFGARVGMVFVEFAFDTWIEDELLIPIKQLWPMGVWERDENPLLLSSPAPVRALPPPIALPPVTVESKIVDAADDPDVADFYCPRSTEDLIDAIEEIFGEEALDLLPGYEQYLKGELTGWVLTDNDDDVIDVEEVSSDG